MSNNMYDDLINLALDVKDFKWAEELSNLKQLNIVSNLDDTSTIYKLKSIALEDIMNNFGIKESNGIRNINYNSEFDILEGNIVILNKDKYNKSEAVYYAELNHDESMYVRGYFNALRINKNDKYEDGYQAGYQDGYNKGCEYTYEIIGGHEKTINDLKNVLGDKPKNKKKWSLFSFKNICKQK